MRRHLQEQDVLKFSSSIAYSQRDTFQVNLHVVSLNQWWKSIYLCPRTFRTTQRFSKRTRTACLPLSQDRFLRVLRPPAYCPRPFLFRGRIRGYRKKPCPCVRSPSLKKCTFHRLVGKEFINASCTYTHMVFGEYPRSGTVVKFTELIIERGAWQT